jgi:hypothetical protein
VTVLMTHSYTYRDFSLSPVVAQASLCHVNAVSVGRYENSSAVNGILDMPCL